MTRSADRLTLHDGATVLQDGVAVPRTARARAHAKAILIGEHAVVHGGPAIALPVDALRLTATVTPTAGPLTIDSVLHTGPLADAPARLAAPATAVTATLARLGLPKRGLDVRIDGEIPAERGLGSSAAVAAAISRAVARAHGVELDPVALFELVQAAETVAHGKPSGLDASAVISAAPIRFRRGRAERIPVAVDGVFVIADTGITGGTREAVADVARLKRADEARVSSILTRIDQHTAAAAADLADGDAAALGERMSAAHELLRELTVSNAVLDRLVEAARAAGALGAKLTGGGRGGCVIALAPAAAAGRVSSALSAAGAVRTWRLAAEDLTA